MPPPGLRHTRRVSRLIGLGLGLALAGAVAAGEGGELAGMRVTGVVMVPGESGLAVIEFRNGEQRFLRAGDQLPGIGSIAEVLPTGIRLQTPKGSRLVNLEWGAEAAGAPPSAAAPGVDQSAAGLATAQPTGHRMPGSIQVTPEVLSAIDRVAATPGAGDAEFRQALNPMLGLPGDARVSSFFPGQPEREAKGMGEVGASLARGEFVRMRVESGGREQMVYIMPGQRGAAGSVGPSVRTK